MRVDPPSALVRYGIAVVSPLLAMGLRGVLWPVWGNQVPYMTFFPAVMLSAYVGGLRTGLASTVLSALLAVYVLIDPQYAFDIKNASDAVGLIVFVLVGWFVSELCESLHRSRRRLAAAARRLEAGEARHRVTLASIGDAVVVTDAAGRVTFLNGVAEALTGWPAAEAAGRPLGRVLALFRGKTGQPADSPAEKALRAGGSVGPGEDTVLRSRDGTDRPVADSAAPIRGPGGRVEGAVLVFRDVAEERRARDALQEADRRKDEFLAMLSHELRNPLAPLRNALELLRGPDAGGARLAWARDVMERQLQQLTRLVDDLLDVSRITRGKITLRKEPVRLADVVAQAVETSRPLIDLRRQRLTVEGPAEAVELEADPTRLAQVLANLLNNASKYTEEGGRIALTCGREGRQAVLRVRDTGIGIPPDVLPRVFDLFAQADSTLARSEGGLGIGLTLVKRLAELHGGTAAAHSDGPGKGSTFTVRLPLPAAAAAPVAPSRAGRPAPDGPRRRVLVVDDNVDAAESLAALLQVHGHEPRTAHSGPDALAAAGEFRPDLVLLDIGLPGMDGYAIARALRGEPWGRGLRLVALTGYGQDDDRRRALEAGFDQHLTKPAGPEVLLRLLADCPPAGA
jgi:PAS domain S-box-containing protein